MNRIAPNENEIWCYWLQAPDGSGLREDDGCERIRQLISGYLKKVADLDGWNVLYEDPEDGRFWEVDYPYGSMHGGGPPMLRCISAIEAAKRYGI